MGAMVLCGAVPVYVNPECDDRLGIPLGMSLSAVKKAIRENPDAKAVLVNNPTYYGICSDLRGIVAVSYTHLDVYKRQLLHSPFVDKAQKNC